MIESSTLIVLAGGLGSRMGMAKGDLRVDGVPILAHLLNHWKWPGPTLLVTAPGRENPPGSDRFDREVCDPISGAGPLRGLLTALENISTSRIVLAAVDMPCLDREQFDWVLGALEQSSVLGVMCRRGEAIEPFPSAFKKEAVLPVRKWLESGRRSMHSLLKNPEILGVHAPAWDEAVWTNINSPADFELFKLGKRFTH